MCWKRKCHCWPYANSTKPHQDFCSTYKKETLHQNSPNKSAFSKMNIWSLLYWYVSVGTNSYIYITCVIHFGTVICLTHFHRIPASSCTRKWISYQRHPVSYWDESIDARFGNPFSLHCLGKSWFGLVMCSLATWMFLGQPFPECITSPSKHEFHVCVCVCNSVPHSTSHFTKCV